jgi:hypothetical protein
MIKLKNLLKEGFAWERNPDGSLPTLADAARKHQKNIQEQSENPTQQLIDMGFNLEKLDNGQTVATLDKGSNNVILIIGTNRIFKGLYTIAGRKGMLGGDLDDPKYFDLIKSKVAKMGITETVTDQEEEELKDIESALKGASKKHKAQADKIGDIVKEVLKDKDGNVRTDLKYTDNQNYQPRIELKNTKMRGGTNFIITVSIDGSKPFEIEFDDHEVVDDHGYEKEVYLMGADAGGNNWGMEGSMAFHGELEDFNIDTLEKEEK